jgi:hypothetical protein
LAFSSFSCWCWACLYCCCEPRARPPKAGILRSHRRPSKGGNGAQNRCAALSEADQSRDVFRRPGLVNRASRHGTDLAGLVRGWSRPARDARRDATNSDRVRGIFLVYRTCRKHVKNDANDPQRTFLFYRLRAVQLGRAFDFALTTLLRDQPKHSVGHFSDLRDCQSCASAALPNAVA